MSSTRTWLCSIAATVLALTAIACNEDSGNTARPATRSPLAGVPGFEDRVTLRGNLTLDGAPLETMFLGARVIRDGLVSPCQGLIPSVSGGRYELPVIADSEARGCGVDGAQILLWVYAGDRLLFSAELSPWPGAGRAMTFDASFSSGDPDGASSPVTELKGRLFDASGKQLPGGTLVEAFVGETLCGVTSLRRNDVTEGYYTLFVAGPTNVRGCTEGAPVHFRVDGKAAVETATNDLAINEGEELDLTVR